MKKLFYFLMCLTVLVACKTGEDKEANAAGNDLENYGAFDVKMDDVIGVDNMLEQFKMDAEPQFFTFKGKIDAVCSKAGCWVSVENGQGVDFMIRFKDHFTIPTDTELNQMAYIHGIAYWDEISIEELKEDAEYEGRSKEEIDAITTPKKVFSFEADGIKIKKPIEE